MSLGNITSINQLPENILLEILRFLPVKDRCIAGRVCKQWRRIVQDYSLWKHVNLLDYRLVLSKMWKVLRAHFSPSLLTMRIRGYAHADNHKRKKASVSDAMLRELATRCPNLWLLELQDCNTDNLSFKSLPSSITSLAVTYSTWQPRWMRNQQQQLPKLKSLNLSSSIRVDNFDLEDIAFWTNLKSLSLEGCYRIRSVPGTGIDLIAKHMLSLQSLNLAGTETDGLTVHHIARHMKDLQWLSLANCSQIRDGDLVTLAAGLPKLNNLDISYCDNITMKGLESLFVSKLKILTVLREPRLTDEEVSSLKKGFPHSILINVQ